MWFFFYWLVVEVEEVFFYMLFYDVVLFEVGGVCFGGFFCCEDGDCFVEDCVYNSICDYGGFF